MDLYRIAKHDELHPYKKDVRYGTKIRASAVVAGAGMSEAERRLSAALRDALDGMEDMIGYVPEFFQEKWDHRAYIDRARATLAEFEDE